MQQDTTGRSRPVSLQSRQLRKAERNYPIHDFEQLAMKYASAKFCIYLVEAWPFVAYTDHHISQRMAHWLTLFAEHTFMVEYKPGQDDVLADALSRRPTTDNEVVQTICIVMLDLTTRLQGASAKDTLIQSVWVQLTTGAPRPHRFPQLDRYSIEFRWSPCPSPSRDRRSSHLCTL